MASTTWDPVRSGRVTATQAPSGRRRAEARGRTREPARTDAGRGRRADLQRPRLPSDGDVGAALEQPEAAHARAPQGVARLRRPPGTALAVPRRPGLPARRRARG